jgi:hypothetical protein
VPTIVPISGAPVVSEIIPTLIPTSSFEGQSTATPGERRKPPIALTLVLLGFCCIFLLILGVIVLGFVVRAQNTKAGKNA